MRIFQVDAFTRRRFTGNPATVVLDADGLEDAVLASIAREFPHAETAFVLAATRRDHDVRMRFFNARRESPFVGHATIAAHAVLLALGRRAPGTMRQLSGTGVIEVRASGARPAADRECLVEFRQGAAELEDPLPLKITLRIAEALRLQGTRLHESLPARIARKGSTRLLLPVSDSAALDMLAPNFNGLESIGAEIGADGFFVFAVNRGGSAGAELAAQELRAQDLSTESRMFCPALGIDEDPVSGNAHAMLATYLSALGEFGPGTTSFVGLQGRHMQRPGQVLVGLEFESTPLAAGRLAAARIGGHAVIVSEGTLAP